MTARIGLGDAGVIILIACFGAITRYPIVTGSGGAVAADAIAAGFANSTELVVVAIAAVVVWYPFVEAD